MADETLEDLLKEMHQESDDSARRKRAEYLLPHLVAIKKQDLAYSKIVLGVMSGEMDADAALAAFYDMHMGYLRREFWLSRDRFLELMWHMSGAAIRQEQFDKWLRSERIPPTPPEFRRK